MALPEAQVCVVVCGILKVKRAAVAPLVSDAVPVVRVPRVVAPQVRVIGLRAYVRVICRQPESHRNHYAGAAGDGNRRLQNRT